VCLCAELRSEVDPSAHRKRQAGVPAGSRGNATDGENARVSQGRRTERTLARRVPYLAVVATRLGLAVAVAEAVTVVR